MMTDSLRASWSETVRFQIILGVLNAVIDTSIIWQCYYYGDFALIRKLFKFRRPAVTTSTIVPTPRMDLYPPYNATCEVKEIDKVDYPLPPNAAISPQDMESVPEESRQWRSALYHTAFIGVVVGLSVVVWAVVVLRVRKTATLKPGEDGTDPVFSKAGAVFGWLNTAMYSK